MFDLGLFVLGFTVGIIAYYYIQNAFYHKKLELLHDVQSELAFLYQKLHNIADVIRSKSHA